MSAEVLENLEAAIAATNASLASLLPSRENGAPGASSFSSGPSFLEKPAMTGTVEEMHGLLGREEGNRGWTPPRLVTECSALARPGYDSGEAHEFLDDFETLCQKVAVLADMVRRSAHTVVYTGAGVSTAAGIGDYASRSAASLATGSRASATRPRFVLGLHARPSFAHFALAALYRKGHLSHWLQQNHDGLAQKAGFPQSALNEIHGSWFDPTNPVVPMNGSLRPDLLKWMQEQKDTAELVVAMGTSLCGMNADSIVKAVAKRHTTNDKSCLGAVIIGFQRSPLDRKASLRIFAPIDDVMCLLAMELGLRVDASPYVATASPSERSHQFRVPYDREGFRVDPSSGTVWNLSKNAAIRVTGGPGAGFVGKVLAAPTEKTLSYDLQFPSMREACDSHFHVQSGNSINARYKLGLWWLDAAIAGELERLPFVNC